MPSVFLPRISVVHVYLSIAATTQDPVGRDPNHGSTFLVALLVFFVFSDTESLYYSALCPYSSVTIPLLLVDLEI